MPHSMGVSGLLNVVLHVLVFRGAIAWITQCIDRREDKIIFNCPSDHVIYQPKIVLGASANDRCRFQDGDCTGLTLELRKERAACFWSKWCKLRWRSTQPMTSPVNTTCDSVRPTYVMYDNPTCIQTDEILDICSRDSQLSRITKGVIRSSPSYPYNYDDMMTSCSQVLRFRPGHTLVITVDDLDTNGHNQDHLKISSQAGPRDKVLFYRRGLESNEENFLIQGENVTITFSISAGRRAGRGFILRFEYMKDESTQRTIKDLVQTPSVKNSQLTNTAVTVTGSVDKCIVSRKDSMSIVCPSGHVIFKPEFVAGVSNGGQCMSVPGDCQGLTHTLITQRNRCYWKNACDFSWTRGVPLTMTSTMNCLAQVPKYISVESYQCKPKGSVFNICDRAIDVINATAGIIRSHSNYPWHYSAIETTCRKYIPVHNTYGLRIYTEEIDLDPDTRQDNLRFFNAKGEMKKVRGSQNVDITVKDGCVMLQFHVSMRSKGGKGFILKFQTAVKSSGETKTLPSHTCEDMMKRKKHGRSTGVKARGGQRTRCSDSTGTKVRCKKIRRRKKGKKGITVVKAMVRKSGRMQNTEGEKTRKGRRNRRGREKKRRNRRKNRRGRRKKKNKWRRRGRRPNVRQTSVDGTWNTINSEAS
ncbi:uncharacterized protein LOC124290682 [Haliotis rubra]|uniref:uncharacterized protein LOC124290682 n=1 Tax=Haliotis rubra TaxID=36100 RepID=UPI001EE57B31|nr:uncharacterized protein LOC124290682 [Haliotis rubra]